MLDQRRRRWADVVYMFLQMLCVCWDSFEVCVGHIGLRDMSANHIHVLYSSTFDPALKSTTNVVQSLWVLTPLVY